MSIVFSCVIPASKKDAESQLLKDLISSIRGQNFPQEQIEILVETDGDSEQAKASGIKKAKGTICAMFCADNYVTNSNLFSNVYDQLIIKGYSATYPIRYAYQSFDNSLNRYFSLIGGNDPICYYLGKNDRHPHAESLRITSDYLSSYGCNGFFYRSELIKATDLDHYYPMDNALEVGGKWSGIDCDYVWHRTSDNLFTFLKKRYSYARDLYCDRTDRRWKMLASKEDYIRLALFCLYTLTIIEPLAKSIRGFQKVRDWAWFWHWPVCFGFLITYTALVIRNIFKHGVLFQKRPSLSPR